MLRDAYKYLVPQRTGAIDGADPVGDTVSVCLSLSHKGPKILQHSLQSGPLKTIVARLRWNCSHAFQGDVNTHFKKVKRIAVLAG